MSRHTLSLRGATKGSDAAIHRASRDAFGFWRFAYWFTVDRYGLRPRDDKTGECPAPRPCHCEERPTGGTRQSIVPRRTRPDSAVRLWVHSGSPRLSGSR